MKVINLPQQWHFPEYETKNIVIIEMNKLF